MKSTRIVSQKTGQKMNWSPGRSHEPNIKSKNDTHLLAGKLTVLDLEPTRAHDLALDDKHLECSRVGAKNVTESVTRQVGREDILCHRA